MTASVGFLADHFSVKRDRGTWHSGAMDMPSRVHTLGPETRDLYRLSCPLNGDVMISYRSLRDSAESGPFRQRYIVPDHAKQDAFFSCHVPIHLVFRRPGPSFRRGDRVSRSRRDSHAREQISRLAECRHPVL
jgi:hypothetical protein